MQPTENDWYRAELVPPVPPILPSEFERLDLSRTLVYLPLCLVYALCRLLVGRIPRGAVRLYEDARHAEEASGNSYGFICRAVPRARSAFKGRRRRSRNGSEGMLHLCCLVNAADHHTL